VLLAQRSGAVTPAIIGRRLNESPHVSQSRLELAVAVARAGRSRCRGLPLRSAPSTAAGNHGRGPATGSFGVNMVDCPGWAVTDLGRSVTRYELVTSRPRPSPDSTRGRETHIPQTHRPSVTCKPGPAESSRCVQRARGVNCRERQPCFAHGCASPLATGRSPPTSRSPPIGHAQAHRIMRVQYGWAQIWPCTGLAQPSAGQPRPHRILCSVSPEAENRAHADMRGECSRAANPVWACVGRPSRPDIRPRPRLSHPLQGRDPARR
jgi:hypothetical protein